MNGKRIQVIDAARGTAMFFVCLSHFAEVYFKGAENSSLLQLSYRISMIASPTFMIISGSMLGFLYATHQNDFGRIKAKYLARGLFLLTLGHILIFLAHIAISGGVREALKWGFITDTIGVSLILGSQIISRIPEKNRLTLGLTLYAVGTVATIVWNPESMALRYIKDVMIGEPYGIGVHTEFFAFVPWFSLYLVGMWIGGQLGVLHMNGDQAGIRRLYFRATFVGLGIALAMVVIRKILDSYGLLPDGIPSIEALFWTAHKRPPSPAYFCLYSGLGLAIMYLMFRFEGKSRLLAGYMRIASMSGRVSVFMFIVQYYVYFTIFVLADLPYSHLWPLYFIASVAVVAFVSQIWDNGNYNRFLWMPYNAIARRLEPFLSHIFGQ